MKHIDRQILRLAVPSIVSNITVPLLGLVDMAIVGHMGGAVYIGAVSVGAMVFNLIYWVFGFLRMGTSGMTSQALGKRDLNGVAQMLARSVIVAWGIAAVIIIAQWPIKKLAFLVIGPEKEVAMMASDYFDICVWGAPAMLTLYSLSGWFVGMQNTRIPMMVSILHNVVNIAASLVMVYGLHMKVQGVATGTVIAQYVGVVFAVGLLNKNYRKLYKYLIWRNCLEKSKMLKFFKVNSDIFLRTLCLVAVNTFFLSAGARQGAVVLAVNTLLMQLFIFFSYFLDGFAYAGEALCGKLYGADNRRAFQTTVRRVMEWGAWVAGGFAILYLFEGQSILNLLTDEGDVLMTADSYLYWAVAIPVVGVVAFIWDGMFVGITATRGMLVCAWVATFVFFVLFLSLQTFWGNHALWMAFLAFLATRGIFQTFYYKKCCVF
jgi:MATE family multidrug resistance protein